MGDRKKVKDSVQIGMCSWGWSGSVEEFHSLVDQFVKQAEAAEMTDLAIVLGSSEDYDGSSVVDFRVEGLRDETDREMKKREQKESIELEEAHLSHFGDMLEWARESIRLGTAETKDFRVEFICPRCKESIKLRELQDDDVAVRVMLPCSTCTAVTNTLPAMLFKNERV